MSNSIEILLLPIDLTAFMTPVIARTDTVPTMTDVDSFLSYGCHRMLRTFLAVLAIAFLLGVLSLLTIESRSVTEDYYVAHANRVRAVETSKDDLATIVQGSQSAFDEGRSISESVDVAFDRLVTNNAVLQEMHLAVRPESPVLNNFPSMTLHCPGFWRPGRVLQTGRMDLPMRFEPCRKSHR